MTRSRLIIAAVAITVAVVVGGFVAYDQVLRGDSATALSLPDGLDPTARGKRRRQRLRRRPCLESGDLDRGRWRRRWDLERGRRAASPATASASSSPACPPRATPSVAPTR